MRAIRLRTEYLTEPLGIDIARPRLSWNAEDGIRQTAYRIVATRDGDTVWDTGKVASDRMTLIGWDGPELVSRDRIEWTVTLWDETGASGESTASWFELGLLNSADWTASWITGDYDPERGVRYPVDHFRKSFRVKGGVTRARLYITAAGVYDASINGQPVSPHRLAPGSTDYRHRLHYQSYDATDLLTGENALEVAVADGWYRGSLGAYGPTAVFGQRTKVLAQLELTYTDGSQDTIATGDDWAWSNDGPVRFADLQDGEVIDASLTPSYDGHARLANPEVTPTASNSVASSEHEEFTPTLFTTPSGARVLDFGQNIAGFVGFTVTGAKGQTLTLRLGEKLDENGEFTQANFQVHKPAAGYDQSSLMQVLMGQYDQIEGGLQPTPKQEIVFTASGSTDTYRTRFAIFGFRYALLDTDIPVEAGDFQAIAVYSDLEETGTFTSSNPAIDKFLENTRWSMKGNFLDVPTDCPTRERLGWTGDAQIFYDTAAYLADVAPFYRKWLADVRDAQHDDGSIPAVAPYSGFEMVYDSSGTSAGWPDAIVLAPYRQWRRYGDESVLRDNYDAMRRFAANVIANTGHIDPEDSARNPFNHYVYEKGVQLGEWLEPAEYHDALPGRTPHPEVATAYLHYTMTHLAEIATVLGETTDAAHFQEYADGAKQAFHHLYLADRAIDTDRQAELVRPLAFGLADGETRTQLQDRLVRAVENRGYRVGTGFLSTPFLLPALTDAGRPDVAYRMLENKQAPSWLAEVVAGATTVWEDWEGDASLNHYSPGAVCQWLFDTVAGIRVTGENRFTIAPVPGGTLMHASAGYASPYGVVHSSWKRRNDHALELTVTLPSNTRGEVLLPDGSAASIDAGTHEFTWRVPHGEVSK